MLTAFGLFILYSATYAASGFHEVTRQLFYFLFGAFLAMLLIFFDYRSLHKCCKYIYGFVIFLLVLVVIIGKEALGAQRWISLGPLGTFQPSEIAKLGLIITISSYLTKQEFQVHWKAFLLTGIHIGIPALLIMKQPDLGTSLVLVACTFGILFVTGYHPLLLTIVIIAGGGGIINFLSEYQKARLLVFIDPTKDPQGSGWNIIQSLIAVGSGGVFGKGYLGGTQTQLRFVPEHHTDFIFTVIAEETGFLGSLILLILYFLLLWFGIKIAIKAKDRFGKLLATGIVVMFLFHILVNIGMTMGIMPITGIPLPFISYGGSALITNLLAVGLLINIHFRQDILIP